MCILETAISIARVRGHLKTLDPRVRCCWQSFVKLNLTYFTLRLYLMPWLSTTLLITLRDLFQPLVVVGIAL